MLLWTHTGTMVLCINLTHTHRHTHSHTCKHVAFLLMLFSCQLLLQSLLHDGLLLSISLSVSVLFSNLPPPLLPPQVMSASAPLSSLSLPPQKSRYRTTMFVLYSQKKNKKHTNKQKTMSRNL